MTKKVKDKDFVIRFKDKKSFTADDVYSFYSRNEPGIKRSTVRWRIYNYIRKGTIKRISRGVYSMGKGKNFSHSLSGEHKKISREIKKSFPFVTYCCWDISVLKEFFQHMPKQQFFFIEVEKDAVEAVFYFLRETRENVFKDFDKNIIENYIEEKQESVIVKPLISESPLTEFDGTPVPVLEKILVDILAERELFYFLQGNELKHIYKNAFDKYTIQKSKLIRYAGRRGKKEEIKKVLEQINGNKT